MRYISLYVMIALYLAAGVNHFIHPGTYKTIMPRFIPAGLNLPFVWVSGACEIVFGLLLIPTGSRWLAAWLIIALLVAVFPANVQMAIDFQRRHSPYTWLAILRLPVQILLIVWAYSFTSRNN